MQLAGRLFGDPASARTGIVFAHMLPADQTSWFEFAKRRRDQGYLALTFDFRGYCPGGDGGGRRRRRPIASRAVASCPRSTRLGSRFGGIIACNRPVEPETAGEIIAPRSYYECIIAPGFSRKPWSFSAAGKSGATASA